LPIIKRVYRSGSNLIAIVWMTLTAEEVAWAAKATSWKSKPNKTK